ASSTMTIVAGTGFSDATAAAPVGGNSGTTVGQQRLIALQYAANLWGAVLTSTQAIRIDAKFDGTLSCGTSSGVLGQAGANAYFRDFSGAPVAGTWYPVALANALSHSDLCPPASACTTAGLDPEDINATFQANLGTSGCLSGLTWYYGLDGNPGAGQFDFVTVALHELGHGLG